MALSLQHPYETEWISTSKGKLRLIDEMVYRWEMLDISSGFTEIFVIYELNNGLFVAVRYAAAGRKTIWSWFQKSEIWDSRPLEVHESSAEQAVGLLVTAETEIPPHLESVREAVLHKLKPPPPRDFAHWEGKVRFYPVGGQQKAHQQDAVRLCEAIVEHGFAFVQQMRDWEPTRPTHEVISLSHMAHSLLSQYEVDDENWWGSFNEIPPATVAINELQWPKGFETARALVETLIDRLKPALHVCVGAFRPGDPDRPSLQEKHFAMEFLKAELPFVEEKILALRRWIQAFQNPPEVAKENVPASPAPKMPSDDAIRIYYLSAGTGEKQEQVAEAFTKATGKPMTQGQVSRHLTAVQEWRDAGNSIPVLPPPLPRIRPIDPAELDKGARLDGRTPRQRDQRE